MDPGPVRFARRSRRPRFRPSVVLLVGLLVVAAACAPSNPEPPSASATTASSVSPTPSAATSPTGTPAATAAAPDRPLATSGSIAVLHMDGSLWLVDAGGRTMLLADTQDGAFGFPTWSPDGSRIAVFRSGAAEAAILVFNIEGATIGLPLVPRTIFRSATVDPFYLSWTPDGKDVSFLASDAEGLKLWIAPQDGSAPLDGSGPEAVIRAGDPFYFDWIDPGHLLAHIGSGPDAFLGEIGRDGSPVAPAIETPGSFRSADVSGDGRFMGFVRAGKDGADAVVVAARDGSSEHSMPVFGMAAVEFGPTDDTLVSIGPIEARERPLSIPLGPLRLIEAGSGAIRTLLDGDVLSFAWSPDGTTIAAIRVIPVAGGSAASSASPTTSPQPSRRGEVRLAFVDVASGEIKSEPVIAPGSRFINGLLSYFDQYSLSHRLWAPDSSSILVPQVDPDGSTRVDVIFSNGDPPVSLDGEIGFWSP